jgi:LmbE family N-acetylglucosaminyl deacetylase
VKEVLFMGEEDGFLRPTRRLRERVTRQIRRIKPELIICTDPDRYLVGDAYINHPDHRNAGLIALEAIFPAADNPMFYPEMADEGYHPHKVTQLYVFGHPQPNIRFDITDDINTKIQSILCHKTQIEDPEEAPARWLERWGEVQTDGTKRYFEVFKAMRFE